MQFICLWLPIKHDDDNTMACCFVKFVPMLLVVFSLLVDKLYASKFVPMLLVVISLLVDKLYASKFVPMLLVVISLLVDKNLFVFFLAKATRH